MEMPVMKRNAYFSTCHEIGSVDGHDRLEYLTQSASRRPFTTNGTGREKRNLLQKREKSVPNSFHMVNKANGVNGRRFYQFSVVRQRPVSGKAKVRLNDSPMMLLPKARLREAVDAIEFVNSLRDGSVIPLDTISALKLTTIQAAYDSVQGVCPAEKSRWARPMSSAALNREHQVKHQVEFEGFVSSRASSACETSRSSSRPISPQSNSDETDFFRELTAESLLPAIPRREQFQGHLESYAKETEMKQKFFRRRNTIANIPLAETSAVAKEHRVSVGFPRMSYFNGIASFLGWMISRFGDRKELQHLPKSNYVVRGSNPYFTNFVYKVPLHQRVDSSDGLDGEERREPPIASPSQSHLRGSYRCRLSSAAHMKCRRAGCSGAEGRPGSPTSCVSHGDIDEEEIDISVEFKNLIDPSLKRESPGIPSPPPQSWHSNSGSVESLLPSKQPETVKPLQIQPKPPNSQRRKHSIIKKVKKPIERPRPVNPPEPGPEVSGEPEVPVDDTPVSIETATSEAPALPKVEAVVPDLPKTKEQTKAERKQSRSRRALMFNTQEPYINPDLLEKMDPELRLNKHVDISLSSESEDSSSKPIARIQPWIQGRLALSKQSSRFELPMDMKLLEDLSPQDYIRKYCVISSRRQYLYQKVFYKTKDKSGCVPVQDLEKGLKEVLVGTLTKDKVTELCDWLEINEDTKINDKLFYGMAALAERILYPEFVTGDTHDIPEFQRDKIECADFGALSWKLNGININPSMERLLKMIS